MTKTYPSSVRLVRSDSQSRRSRAEEVASEVLIVRQMLNQVQVSKMLAGYGPTRFVRATRVGRNKPAAPLVVCAGRWLRS
jgi:hypothetical protein